MFFVASRKNIFDQENNATEEEQNFIQVVKELYEHHKIW
jgi:hypothetical protein